MSTPVLVSFGLYLLLMLVIGIYFYRTTSSLSDYILGGRNLPAGVAALGAGASDLSGWALMGLPGAVFARGFLKHGLPSGHLSASTSTGK